MIAQRRFSRRPWRSRLATTRHLHAELLERRDLLAADWHNEILPADVDYSGHLSVNDALLVVGDLRANGIRDLTDTPPPIAGEPPFLDVNADNIAAVSDALDIVSQLRVTTSTLAIGFKETIASGAEGVVSITADVQTDGQAFTVDSINGRVEFSDTLTDAVSNGTSGSRFFVIRGIFDGVTLNTTAIIDDGRSLPIRNGLTVNGTLILAPGSRLTGNSQIDFGSNSTLQVNLAGTSTSQFGRTSPLLPTILQCTQANCRGCTRAAHVPRIAYRNVPLNKDSIKSFSTSSWDIEEMGSTLSPSSITASRAAK